MTDDQRLRSTTDDSFLLSDEIFQSEQAGANLWTRQCVLGHRNYSLLQFSGPRLGPIPESNPSA